MPSINKAFTLEVTPQQFINQCSATELQELEILLSSPGVQARMAHASGDGPAIEETEVTC